MESNAFNIPLTRVNYSLFGGSISRIRETGSCVAARTRI